MDEKQLLPDIKKMEDDVAKWVAEYKNPDLISLYDELKGKPDEKMLPNGDRYGRIASICRALLYKVDQPEEKMSRSQELEKKLFVMGLEKFQHEALEAINILSRIALEKVMKAEAEAKSEKPLPPPTPSRVIVEMPKELRESPTPAQPVKKDTVESSPDDAAEKLRRQQDVKAWVEKKEAEAARKAEEKAKQDKEQDARIEAYGKLHDAIEVIYEKLKVYKSHSSLSESSKEKLNNLEHALTVDVHRLEHQAGEELTDFKKRLNSFVGECEKKFDDFVESTKVTVTKNLSFEETVTVPKEVLSEVTEGIPAPQKKEDYKQDDNFQSILDSLEAYLPVKKSDAPPMQNFDEVSENLRDANKELMKDLRTKKEKFLEAISDGLAEKRSTVSAEIGLSAEVIKSLEENHVKRSGSDEVSDAIHAAAKKWWDFLPNRVADTISITFAGIPPYQERVDRVKQQCVSAACFADLSNPVKFHSENISCAADVVSTALAKGGFEQLVNQNRIVKSFLIHVGLLEKVQEKIKEVESKKVEMGSVAPQRKRKFSEVEVSKDNDATLESPVKRTLGAVKEKWLKRARREESGSREVPDMDEMLKRMEQNDQQEREHQELMAKRNSTGRDKPHR